MADPALEEIDPTKLAIAEPEATADEAAEADKTPSDTEEARLPETADAADEAESDDAPIVDPLVLAQMKPEDQPEASAKPQKIESVAPESQAKAKSEENDPSSSAGNAPKSEKKEVKVPDPVVDEYDQLEAEALSDIPEEDWRDGKLTHKGKSQFLAQRKVIKAQRERVKAADIKAKTEAAARAEAEQKYGNVEKFVKDSDLENEEFYNSVATAGMIKKGDPKAITILENTLKVLRQQTGQHEAPVAPPAPTLDAELEELIKQSEEYGIDTSKVKAKYKPVTPPASVVQAQPTPVPQPSAQSQAAPDAELQEFGAIIDALHNEGIADPNARVSELFTKDPNLKALPVGKRLTAIIKAHVLASVAPPQPQKAQPPRVPTTAPLSSRGRTPTVVARSAASGVVDPLKHALGPAR